MPSTTGRTLLQLRLHIHTLKRETQADTEGPGFHRLKRVFTGKPERVRNGKRRLLLLLPETAH